MSRIVTKIIEELDLSIPFEKILRKAIVSPTISEIEKYISDYELESMDDPNVKQDSLIESDYFVSNHAEDKILRVVLYGAFDTKDNLMSLVERLVEQNDGNILLLGILDKDAFLSMSEETALEMITRSCYEKILEYSPETLQIIGHSFGGLLALNVAKRCLESGIQVNNLSIIEGGYLPNVELEELYLELVFLQAYGSKTMEALFCNQEDLENALYGSINKDGKFSLENFLNGITNKSDYETIVALSNANKEERFEKYLKAVSQNNNSIGKTALEYSFELFKKSIKLEKQAPDVYFGDVDYYSGKDNRGAYKHLEIIKRKMEEVIIGNLNIIEVPGNHYSMLQEENCLDTLSAYLKAR